MQSEGIFSPGLHWRIVDRREFKSLVGEQRKQLFSVGQRFETPQLRRLRDPLSSEEIIVLEKAGEPAAWTWSREESAGTIQMVESAVLPDFQGQGLYQMLQNLVLERARNKGLTEVMAQIRADHNDMLIPKLKAGFIITGMQISPRFGTMLQLSYPLREEIRQQIAIRTGRRRPNQ